MKNEYARKEAMLRVMQAWATRDARAALEWAKGAAFDNSYERGVAMSMACTQVAKDDPLRAINLAIDYQLDEDSNGLLEGLTARWAEDNLPAARAWAISQPPGRQRDDLVESIALASFDESPGEAVHLVLVQIPTGERQNLAVLDIVSRFTFQNPAAAQAWVESFPAGPLRDRAIRQWQAMQSQQTGNW